MTCTAVNCQTVECRISDVYRDSLRTRVSITGIESVRGEAVTSGGLDRSLRVWKIPEETQLMFQSAPRLSTALLPGQRRVPRRNSVRESCLCAVDKKRPLFVEEGHGSVSSVRCSNSDLVLSRANGGVVKIWWVIPS